MVSVLKILLVIVILLAAGGLASLVYQKTIVSQKTIVHSTMDQLKSMLLQKSKINFPATTSAVLINIASSDVAYFIPADAVDKTIQEVTYAGGKKGYIIHFALALAMDEAYHHTYYDSFYQTGLWKQTLGVKGHNSQGSFRLIEIQNASHTLKMTFQNDGASLNLTHVSMQVIEN